jgi:hypothetical protein
MRDVLRSRQDKCRCCPGARLEEGKELTLPVDDIDIAGLVEEVFMSIVIVEDDTAIDISLLRHVSKRQPGFSRQGLLNKTTTHPLKR